MLVLYNARIHTLDTRRPLASALAIEGGRVLAMGENSQIREGFGGCGQAQDLEGRVVIPGLADAHIHLGSYVLSLERVDCQTPTRQECIRRVGERTKALPPGTWILGQGWNQNDWSEGFGQASDLDEVAPGNPVFLVAKSGHAAWVNSLALAGAGITAETPDPLGGRIGRDEYGGPSGLLFEGAIRLVREVIPELPPREMAEALKKAQASLWRLGITSIHDLDGKRSFIGLQVLRGRGELSLRVIKGLPWDDFPYAEALGLSSGFGDDFLRFGPVKLLADGALGPHTAAMLEPYEGEPNNRGMLLLDAGELFERGRKVVEAGFPLAVHAIGDGANREALVAFARIRKYEQARGLPAQRHRIEHVQLLAPEDLPKLAWLGLVASMQPLHASSDMPMADRYWGKRCRYAYAWRTLLDYGTALAFGSDAPVDPPNPFWGIHAAATRRRADGSPAPEGWYPEQRLSVEEALRAYIFGPAYAAGLESRLGKLAPAYLADLVVLDADPFAVEAEALRNIQPLATMVGGEWVWQR